jgi:hypothetical protein
MWGKLRYSKIIDITGTIMSIIQWPVLHLKHCSAIEICLPHRVQLSFDLNKR